MNRISLIAGLSVSLMIASLASASLTARAELRSGSIVGNGRSGSIIGNGRSGSIVGNGSRQQVRMVADDSTDGGPGENRNAAPQDWHGVRSVSAELRSGTVIGNGRSGSIVGNGSRHQVRTVAEGVGPKRYVAPEGCHGN